MDVFGDLLPLLGHYSTALCRGEVHQVHQRPHLRRVRAVAMGPVWRLDAPYAVDSFKAARKRPRDTPWKTNMEPENNQDKFGYSVTIAARMGCSRPCKNSR